MSNPQLVHFIKQRHQAYLHRKHGGEAPTDPALRTFRFTNLNRDLDATTIVRRELYAEVPRQYKVLAAVVGCTINHTETLREIWPFLLNHEFKSMKNCLLSRQGQGLKFKSDAYIVAPKYAPWGEYMVREVYVPLYWRLNHRREDVLYDEYATLAEFAPHLLELNRVGSFMCGQLIADLKGENGLDWMEHCTDHKSFALVGPGSKRGAMYVALPGEKWIDTVHRVMRTANMILHVLRATYRVDAQDAQNILCEFDKYMRIQATGTYRRRL